MCWLFSLPLYFRYSLMILVIDVFHQFWVDSCNSYVRVRFLKLPIFPPFRLQAMNTKHLRFHSFFERHREINFSVVCLPRVMFQIKKQFLLCYFLTYPKQLIPKFFISWNANIF